MINRRSGRPALPPPAPPGAEGGDVGRRGGVTAVPSPAPGPRRRPRTCRPPGAPRGCQLSEVARVTRWKMLRGAGGLKGQHPPGCPQPSEGPQGRGGRGSRRTVVFLSPAPHLTGALRGAAGQSGGGWVGRTRPGRDRTVSFGGKAR